MEKVKTFRVFCLGVFAAACCQVGFSAFKEISSTGNVVQASHNAQNLQRTSIESPDYNIPTPPKNSDIWMRISQSTQYGTSIGNEENALSANSPTSTELDIMRKELAKVRIEMAEMQSTLQALQIELMPGSKILTKN